MSFFSWLFSKPAPPQSTGLPPDGLTAPPPPVSHPGGALPATLADLKHQRHERREQLYSVVRSVMLRSEVLASLYRFKVLSLDTRGRQFLIMVDLVGDKALHQDRWGPVEQLIAMTAAQRHDLLVKAVYWRVTEAPVPMAHPAGATVAPAPSTAPAQRPVPMPTGVPAVADSAPAPVAPAHTVRTVPAAKTGGFEPIGQDEVKAFQKAIADVVPKGAGAAESGQVVSSGPRHSVTLTGYEDTQVLEPDDAASPLSRTQFGDL